ncbi:MAG: hypothetical protein OEM52_07915 [bacterium]|nr:hypothetical protein [bacterium]
MANRTKTRSILLWLLAFIIMLASAYYQRRTGPTYPVSGIVKVGGVSVPYYLLRSHGGAGNQPVLLPITDTTVTGVVVWKRYKSHDQWQELPLLQKSLSKETVKEMTGPSVFVGKHFFPAGKPEQDFLYAELPHQPPAGKIEYFVKLTRGNVTAVAPEGHTDVVTRFRGGVPVYVLFPHVLAMFIGMLFGTRVMLAAFAGERLVKRTLITLILLVIGGLILGPIVQKFAFDAYWTGWPFGEDLTDNKTAVMVLVWVIAYWRLRKSDDRKNRWFAVAAMAVMMAVYLIPHSMRGSEIDYTKQAPVAEIR